MQLQLGFKKMRKKEVSAKCLDIRVVFSKLLNIGGLKHIK
jgi:hypothetical protein